MISLGTYRKKVGKTRLKSLTTLNLEPASAGSLYLLGATGEGKSWAMSRVIVQRAMAGESGIFIDFKGDAARDVIERYPGETILVAPGLTKRRWTLNQLDGDPSVVGGNIAAMFEHLGKISNDTTWINSYTAASVALAMTKEHPTLVDALLILSHDAFRERALKDANDPVFDQYWEDYEAKTDYLQETHTASTKYRFWDFLLNYLLRDTISAHESNMTLEEWLNEGKLIVVSFEKLQQHEWRLFGNLIISAFLNLYHQRVTGNQSGRKNWFIAVDEFHQFAATPFAEVITLGRGYGVFTIIAHQTTSQLKGHDVLIEAVKQCWTQVRFYQGYGERRHKQYEAEVSWRDGEKRQMEVVRMLDWGDDFPPDEDRWDRAIKLQEELTTDPEDLPTLNEWVEGLPGNREHQERKKAQKKKDKYADTPEPTTTEYPSEEISPEPNRPVAGDSDQPRQAAFRFKRPD